MPSSTKHLWLEYRPLAELATASRNPKKHDLAGLRGSVGRFGVAQPVAVVDERTGRMVAGHGRRETLLAMRDAGEVPPENVQLAEDGAWLVPVLRGWASRSDEEAEAFLVADNRHTEKGGWDNEQLLDLLKGMDDLTGVGFTAEEIAALDVKIETLPTEGKTDPDDVPEVKGESYVKPGDIWVLGRHRIVCGSSTEPFVVERLMAGEYADAMWTDPPYGVNYVGATKDKLPVHNDDPEGLPDLLRGALGLAGGVIHPGSPVYIAHPAGENAMVFYDVIRELGWRFRQGLVWVKDSFALGRSDYHYRHEPIIFAYTPGGEGRRGRGGEGWYGDNAQDTVFEVPKPKRNGEHPTMKPVELVEAMLKNSTQPGSIVFEPFSGSGTTLITCEKMGLRCRAIELSPAYVQVAIERWQAFTGKRARLLNGDQPEGFEDEGEEV